METEKLLQLEKKYALNMRRYNDVAWWTYGRFQVIRYLDALEKGIQDKEIKKESKREIFIDGICMLWNMLFRERVPKKHVDLCIFNHERRVKEDGYYECIYTERIAEHYPNSVVIERPYGYHHLRPVKTKNLIYCDRIEFEGYFKGLIQEKFHLKKYRKAQNYFKMELEDVIDEIEEIEGVEIDRDNFANIFSHVYFQYIFRKKKLEKLIERISPRIILEVVSYNIDCMIVNEIAKSKEILTVELQHGTMGKGHVAYNYNAEEEIPQFPDKIFLFSDYWRECSQLPVQDKDALAVGYPYFEEKINQYLSVKKKKNIGKEYTILFVSQWIIGKELSMLACEVYDRLKKEDDSYRILYKLHPGEYDNWRKNYPWLRDSKIEVIDSLEHNVYELFAISDIQIGVFSTAIYEGLAFGLKTYIYETHFWENMKELCGLGYAESFKNADEFCHKLTDPNCKMRNKTDQFWKKNAKKNIYKEIDTFLEERYKVEL